MWPDTHDSEQRRFSFIEQARRSQIVSCAIDTIAELGYGQASLAQIAKRAGISKGVISYHFAGKDELMRQVVAEVARATTAFIAPRVAAETTARGRLQAFIGAFVAFLETHRHYMLAMSQIRQNHRPEDGRQRLDLSDHEGYQIGLEAILTQGQEEGEFRTFSTRVMAVTVLHALGGLVTQWAIDPRLDLEAYGEELARIFDIATRQQ